MLVMKQINKHKQSMHAMLALNGEWLRRLARATVAASLLAVTPVQAQLTQGANDQMSNWRQANDAVGKFLRGHIDILKSESQSRKVLTPADTSDQGFALNLAQAKRLMLHARPSLFRVSGDSVIERNAQAIEVTTSLSSLSRAWIEAVGANRLLQLQAKSTEAAQIADELGQRMVEVGNWGVDRALAVGLQASAERLKLLQAQEKAVQTKAALAAWVMISDFSLPDQLPDLRGIGARQDLTANPTQLAQARLERMPSHKSDLVALARLESSVGDASLQQWDSFVQSRVTAALEGQGASALTVDQSAVLWNHQVKEVLDKREAMAARQQAAVNTVAVAQMTVKSRHAETLLLANEILPLAVQAEEEAVYQYNGMFISTWQLLAQFRAKTTVEMNLIETQMRYWDAEYALGAYMAGAPYLPPSGGGASAVGADAGDGGH